MNNVEVEVDPKSDPDRNGVANPNDLVELDPPNRNADGDDENKLKNGVEPQPLPSPDEMKGDFSPSGVAN